MELLPNPKRKDLEIQILVSVCERTEFLDLFDFTDEDFFYPENKKIFAKILELRGESKEINIMAVLGFMGDDFSVVPYVNVWNDGVTMASHTPKSFLELCKVLREDTRKFQLKRLLQNATSSDEFIECLSELANPPLEKPLTFDQKTQQYLEILNDRIKKQSEGKSVGVRTAWKNFDEKVSMIPGDYVVVGARTSIGKTTFALNVAIEAAGLGQKVLFISMEMTEESIFDKIVSRLTQIPVWKFAKGYVDETSFDLVKREIQCIKDNMTFIYLPNCTTSQVANLVKKEGGVDLVVVDYLQLMKDKSQKGETENLRLGRISGTLKAIAGIEKCVMLVPAQLNRESEKNKREPYLADLRDSGCIEQDADKVILLHRETRQSVNAKLILAKNRTGATGEIYFKFDPELSFFSECNDQELQDLEESQIQTQTNIQM